MTYAVGGTATSNPPTRKSNGCASFKDLLQSLPLLLKRCRLRLRSAVRKQVCTGSPSAMTIIGSKPRIGRRFCAIPPRLPGDIRAVLEAENDYARAKLAPAETLRAALFKEMRGRIKEDDSEVPRPDGPWLYYERHKEGGQHPDFCREKRSGGAPEILLDGDMEARGKSFFDIAAACHSPDHAKLGWSADETGSELYAIRIRDFGTGQAGTKGEAADRSEVITDTDGSLVWMADFERFLLCAHR